jgi:hypothetical protein
MLLGDGDVALRTSVQAGDTLQSIAQNLWGEAKLWCLVASANGLNVGAAGQVVPSGANNN